MSALAQRAIVHADTRHTINFKKSGVFCTKKCGRLAAGRPHLKNLPLVCKMFALDKPLSLTADVLYVHWIASNITTQY